MECAVSRAARMAVCRVRAWVSQVLSVGAVEAERVRMLVRVVVCSVWREVRRVFRSAGVRCVEERDSVSG